MKRGNRAAWALPAAEWLLLAALLPAWGYWSFADGVSWTADQAFAKSERTQHYGPSDVKRVVDLGSAKVYLGTYEDRWFSASAVYRDGYRWHAGGGAGPREIDRAEPLTYNYSLGAFGDRRLAIYCGYASSPDIAKVRLVLGPSAAAKSGTDAMRQAVGEDRLFLFVWEEEGTPLEAVTAIEGYGADGDRVYAHRFD